MLYGIVRFKGTADRLDVARSGIALFGYEPISATTAQPTLSCVRTNGVLQSNNSIFVNLMKSINCNLLSRNGS